MKSGSLNLLEPSGPVQGLCHMCFTAILCNQLLVNGSLYEKFPGPNTLKIEVARLSETLARENIHYNAFYIT
jgi:hypothetical protein